MARVGGEGGEAGERTEEKVISLEMALQPSSDAGTCTAATASPGQPAVSNYEPGLAV